MRAIRGIVERESMNGANHGKAILGWGIVLVVVGSVLSVFTPSIIFALSTSYSSATGVAEDFLHLLAYAFLPIGAALVAAGIVVRSLRRDQDEPAQVQNIGGEPR
jgi:Na+/proline symporter